MAIFFLFRGLIIYFIFFLMTTNFHRKKSKNLKIRHCLIDQETAILLVRRLPHWNQALHDWSGGSRSKPGSCLINQDPSSWKVKFTPFPNHKAPAVRGGAVMEVWKIQIGYRPKILKLIPWLYPSQGEHLWRKESDVRRSNKISKKNKTENLPLPPSL